jgi:hypothetical protein
MASSRRSGSITIVSMGMVLNMVMAMAMAMATDMAMDMDMENHGKKEALDHVQES